MFVNQRTFFYSIGSKKSRFSSSNEIRFVSSFLSSIQFLLLQHMVRIEQYRKSTIENEEEIRNHSSIAKRWFLIMFFSRMIEKYNGNDIDSKGKKYANRTMEKMSCCHSGFRSYQNLTMISLLIGLFNGSDTMTNEKKFSEWLSITDNKISISDQKNNSKKRMSIIHSNARWAFDSRAVCRELEDSSKQK